MSSLILLLSLALHGFAADGAKADVQIKKVSVEEVGSKTLVHFELSKNADLVNLEARFLRRTIEWDFKNITIKKDKMFAEILKGDINNIYISHNDDKSIRVRVNLDNSKTASNYHERISFAASDKDFTMILDSDIALITSNIKELNRVYDVAATGNQNAEDHIAAKSVIKVGAGAGTGSSAVDAATADEASEANENLTIEEPKDEKDIPLAPQKNAAKEAASNPLIRIVFGFLALGLMLASVVIIGRKINRKRLSNQFGADSITVISQKYLGPKRNLTMVRVAGEYLLLGVTDHNISLIKTLSIVSDEIPDLTPADFSDTVKQMTSRAEALDEQAGEVEDSFSVSSLSDVKDIFRKKRYIDEQDY